MSTRRSDQAAKRRPGLMPRLQSVRDDRSPLMVQTSFDRMTPRLDLSRPKQYNSVPLEAGNKNHKTGGRTPSATTYDLFAWAAKHNRSAPGSSPEKRRFKIQSGVFDVGYTGGGQAARRRGRFTNYFFLQRARSSVRATEGVNVHRNRVVFLLLLSGLLLYVIGRWVSG